MLPHVVLRTRSLPWTASGGLARLGVLLFAEDELPAGAFVTEAGRERLHCPQGLLLKLLPKQAERPLLCHVRELGSDDPLARKDDDGFVALVVGNRLPAPGKRHVACLVDLRGVSFDPGAELPVLHRWSFTTGTGGDFQQYFARLRDPAGHATGGVRAFGQRSDGTPLGDPDGALSLPAPTAAEPGRRVLYAGPLSPLARAYVDDPAKDVADALAVDMAGTEVVGDVAAFELGRLLARANPRVLEGLLEFRGAQIARDVVIELRTPLPTWSQGQIKFGGTWRDVFQDTRAWFGGTFDDLWRRTGDPTGLLPLLGQIPGLSHERLAGLGGSELAPRLRELGPVGFATDLPGMPGAPPDLAGLDLETLDPISLGAELHARFAELTATIADIDVRVAQEDGP